MISIFSRHTYLGNRFYGDKGMSTQRLSARVRGEEIAKYLGCKHNPKKYDGDVCIWVKPAGLNKVKDGDYVDLLDGDEKLVELIKLRPNVKVIAASQNSFEFIKNTFPNKVVLIPCQHINWDNLLRTRSEINTAGYIGNLSPVSKQIYNEIKNALKKIGFEFIYCYDFKTREDAVSFYQSIDILVIGDWNALDTNQHKIPTKIINAASFGVPTIARPLMGYKEIEGDYIKSRCLEELISGVKILKKQGTHKCMSKRLIRMARNYHISKIAKMYLELT